MGGARLARTLYDAIGIAPDASAGEIEAKCLRLGERYRPEKHPADSDARRRFEEIDLAYETLIDARRRAAYDRSIGVRREPFSGRLGNVGSALVTRWRTTAGVALALMVLTISLYVWSAHRARDESRRQETRAEQARQAERAMESLRKRAAEEIDVRCSVSGGGNVTCTFRNNSNFEVGTCVRVRLVARGEWPECKNPSPHRYGPSNCDGSQKFVESGAICSGLIRAGDVAQRAESAAIHVSSVWNVAGFCNAGNIFAGRHNADWREGCAMQIVRVQS